MIVYPRSFILESKETTPSYTQSFPTNGQSCPKTSVLRNILLKFKWKYLVIVPSISETTTGLFGSNKNIFAYNFYSLKILDSIL